MEYDLGEKNTPNHFSHSIKERTKGSVYQGGGEGVDLPEIFEFSQLKTQACIT